MSPVRKVFRSRNPRKHLSASKLKKDMDLAGFRQFSNDSKPIWGRCLWVMITMITLLTCCYQCGERFQRYLSDPSEINTYYMENKSLTFPSVTVCPSKGVGEIFPQLNPFLYRKRFGNSTMLPPIELLKNENISIIDLWDLAKLDRNWTTFFSMTEPEDDFEKDPFLTVDTNTFYGNCTTFLGRNVRHYGIQSDQTVFIHGENIELPCFKILFHSKDEIDLAKYSMFYNGIDFDYESQDIFLRATELIYRNTRKNPCNDVGITINKCIVFCLEAAIYSRVKKKCRLPFMQQNDVISPCTTVEEFTEIMSATLRVIKLFQKDDCNCMKMCREIIYSVDLVLVSIKPEDKRLVRLWVGFSDPRVTIIEEAPSYSGFDFFSDLGGSIGLFLGISCLQAFEIISAFVSKMGKRCKNNT